MTLTLKQGGSSVLWRWQRLTSHGTASPRGQRAAGDSAPGRFVNPQKKMLKLLLLLLLLLQLLLLLLLLQLLPLLLLLLLLLLLAVAAAAASESINS